ncbi:hypothetical protein AN963_01500 [Brevibacillus choshinensis]|uniref:DUF1802 domain-containing protein n=1 Tax=Brevibacillus choshinensis TaxID=54911 RepID=A0ABR5NAG4_BRECH|nr:DUF1802 family protein [Brevibacillus choshinensis]KQL48513.1 hypothetical protein AN963_01500 [Brevibacillus choshinensis]
MHTITQPVSPLSLKEWAVAVKALGDGHQIITIRKGGLYEETREFRLENNQFYLYPTYEHQKQEMVKPEYQHLLEATRISWSPEKETVEIAYFAEVTDDVELMDEEKLRALSPYHIWTDNFADVRLHWKKQKPLHILFARVYRLQQPVEIHIDEAYKGCKSWHDLLEAIPGQSFEPVLSDAEYAQKKDAILSILNR